MKKVIIILGSYYPNRSANGICVGNVVEELSSECEVIVLCQKKTTDSKNTKDSYSEIRLYDYSENRISLAANERYATAKGFRKCIPFIVKAALGVKRYYQGIIKGTSLNRQKTNAIVCELRNIPGKIDAIVPVCLPFEAVAAATIYKKTNDPEVKIVPMLFDLFAENPVLHRTDRIRRRRHKKHLALERVMCEQCDRLLFIEAWQEHLSKYFTKYSDKFCPIEHPLIKKPLSSERVEYEDGKIHAVYTGALYKTIRSPVFLLELFSRLIEKEPRIVLHLYTKGDCGEIVEKYCRRYPQNILDHGSVSPEKAKAAMLDSDTLLSIGNTNTDQVPSKVFEYISTGKPILHVSASEKDPVKTILQQYRSALCISASPTVTEEQVGIARKFFNTHHGFIAFEDLEEVYYNATPRYTVERITQMI